VKFTIITSKEETRRWKSINVEQIKINLTNPSEGFLTIPLKPLDFFFGIHRSNAVLQWIKILIFRQRKLSKLSNLAVGVPGSYTWKQKHILFELKFSINKNCIKVLFGCENIGKEKSKFFCVNFIFKSATIVYLTMLFIFYVCTFKMLILFCCMF
jgi:hypothetical protein